MYSRVVSLEQTHDSEVSPATIIRAMMTEAVRTSDTSVYSETTLRYISEGYNLPLFFIYNLILPEN
jgi:hypothetical protein